VEKLQTVTDKSALSLGASVGQFLGEAESNTEFEQVFGLGLEAPLVRLARVLSNSGSITLFGVNNHCFDHLTGGRELGY
jgi:hypothetical protein